MIALVLAAHPDDEVLGCGGTIAKLTAEHEVHIAILGEGITARYLRPGASDSSAAVSTLQEEARSVGSLLGAKSVSFQGLPDNRFDEKPLLEVVKSVEHLIQEIGPEVVYTHHPGDLNMDHQITFRAVLTATRPLADCPVQEVYSFEVPSSTEWAFHQLQPPFRPNVFVDISSTIETKLRGLERYKGEQRPFPHPRSREALKAIARRWGSVAGMDYAEAFELIRSLR